MGNDDFNPGLGEARIELSAGGRWLLGGVLVVVGLGLVVLPWVALADSRRAYAAATEQQRYVAGACRATASRTITGLGSQGDDSALAVDFTLEAGGRSYPGLTFTYPTYASPVAVAEGSQVACFYDPDDPTQVTLLRKSAPEGRSPRATVLEYMLTGFGLLVLALAVWTIVARPPGRRRG